MYWNGIEIHVHKVENFYNDDNDGQVNSTTNIVSWSVRHKFCLLFCFSCCFFSMFEIIFKVYGSQTHKSCEQNKCCRLWCRSVPCLSMCESWNPLCRYNCEKVSWTVICGRLNGECMVEKRKPAVPPPPLPTATQTKMGSFLFDLLYLIQIWSFISMYVGTEQLFMWAFHRILYVWKCHKMEVNDTFSRLTIAYGWINKSHENKYSPAPK